MQSQFGCIRLQNQDHKTWCYNSVMSSDEEHDDSLQISLADLFWAVFFFSIVIVLFRDFLSTWFTEVYKVFTKVQ